MATRHILSSPAAAATCCAALGEGDAVVLIANGVFALAGLEPQGACIGVLQDDAAQRGVPLGDALALSDADFVDWVVRHERSVTWR